ncbi:hypothetical protein CAPTEDRAFT_39250, partial [Capitella teleta]
RSSNTGLLLQNRNVRTETFKTSFFNRICHLWNILPAFIRDSPIVSVFKDRL